jgi:hypothetical protein
MSSAGADREKAMQGLRALAESDLDLDIVDDAREVLADIEAEQDGDSR